MGASPAGIAWERKFIRGWSKALCPGSALCGCVTWTNQLSLDCGRARAAEWSIEWRVHWAAPSERSSGGRRKEQTDWAEGRQVRDGSAAVFFPRVVLGVLLLRLGI